MNYLELKERLTARLIEECKAGIAARGGSFKQTVIYDTPGNTRVRVYGLICEEIEVPVQLCGPVDPLDKVEVNSG